MVVVGSMDGCLYGFSEDDGHPMRLAFQNNGTSCEPVVKLDLLDRSKEEPYRATYTYQQLNGAGVEPSLAQSVVDEYGESVAFLVTGANYRTKGSKQPGGRLVAYRTTGRFNTFFERGSIQDADGNTLVSRDRENSFRLPEDQTYTTPAELELGNTYVVNATLGQEKLSADRLFTVWWFWTNQDQSAVRLLDTQYVKGGPGGFDSDLKVYYTPQPGQTGEGWIVGIVNPGEVFWLGTTETEEIFNLLYRKTQRRGNTNELFEYPPPARRTTSSAWPS